MGFIHLYSYVRPVCDHGALSDRYAVRTSGATAFVVLENNGHNEPDGDQDRLEALLCQRQQKES
jgi:hypothetical protein